MDCNKPGSNLPNADKARARAGVAAARVRVHVARVRVSVATVRVHVAKEWVPVRVQVHAPPGWVPVGVQVPADRVRVRTPVKANNRQAWRYGRRRLGLERAASAHGLRTGAAVRRPALAAVRAPKERARSTRTAMRSNGGASDGDC